jgi:hypothetical protein
VGVDYVLVVLHALVPVRLQERERWQDNKLRTGEAAHAEGMAR